MRLVIAAVLIFGIVGCTRTRENKLSTETDSLIIDSLKTEPFDYDAQFKLETYLVPEQIDTSKIQVVDTDCAILIYPTPEQIEEMKKKEGEENFYIGADDSNFYQGQAIGLIDSLGIKTLTANKQFIKFTGERNSWTLDIRRKDTPAWNLILFKKSKMPQVEPTISLTIEKLQSYFQKTE